MNSNKYSDKNTTSLCVLESPFYFYDLYEFMNLKIKNSNWHTRRFAPTKSDYNPSSSVGRALDS